MKKNGGTHGSAQHPAKGQSKAATKALIHQEAKQEAKKEVEKIIHREVNLRVPKKNARSLRGSHLASAAGVHTAVIGTGVETLQGLAGVSPKRALSRDGRECVYSSVDWVGSVTIPAANAVGDRLFSIPLAPALVPVTRLALESQQWEKYMVESWEFLFVTTQGTTTSGQLIAFVDPDPRDDWTDDPYNVSKAAAQFGSMPINVWQNFGTRLPHTRDTKVTSYYTNPTTSSDVRFSQPGVLRVINAGGWSTLPAGGVTVYNVYQRVTLRFMDPELSVTAGAAMRPVGVISDASAKTTAIGTPLLTPSSTIATGVPISVAADGTLNIDTSSVGDNNVVVEFEAEVENNSSVEHTIAIDPQASSALDQSISSVRAVFKADASISGQLTALAHVLLDGTRSWSLQALLLGVATVAVRQATARVWLVPRSTTTLLAAARLTGIKPGIRREPRAKLETYLPPAWYTSSASFGLTKSASITVNPGQTTGLLQVVGPLLGNYRTAGLDMYVYYDTTNHSIGYQWRPADVSEIYYVQFSLYTSQTGGTVTISGPAITAIVNGTITETTNTASTVSTSSTSIAVGVMTPTAINATSNIWIQDPVIYNNTASAITVTYGLSLRITQVLDVAETSWIPAEFHDIHAAILDKCDRAEKHDEEERFHKIKRVSCIKV